MGYYTHEDKKKPSLLETIVTYTFILGFLILASWNFYEALGEVYKFLKGLI
jgi:hypothetical protein